MRKTSEHDNENLIEAAHDLQNLMASQQTLLLSTASLDGIPDISYAPFVRDATGCFYIFVSELASHTANLLNNPKASVMFMAPESESRNLFARERAVLACSAREIAQNDAKYSLQLQALQDKFGHIIATLRSLSDFRLFELCPESGRYVAGFGRAFTVNSNNDSLTRVNQKT